MQILEVSRPRNADVHLTTFRELEQHCQDERKHAGYQRLLKDFGIDATSFTALVEHPRLVLAEQPGSWFCGDDLIRFRLLDVLRQTNGFHPSSGVLSLADDAFTCRGLKKYVLLFHFHAQVEPVHLVGASFIRRHRNRVYSALPIAGTAYERLAAILDSCLAMLESARTSPDAFAEEVLAMFRAGVRCGIRPLLPRRSDRRGLRDFGVLLGEYDLESAAGPLLAARRHLCRGIAWDSYWNKVNASYFGGPVGQLGPLFNQFLLTVADPVRMSHNLIRSCGYSPSKPVAVASVITCGEKYRIVYFDPTQSRFFYVPRPGTKRYVEWHEVRRLAEQGRTGGPSGIIEYLLMAASGIYLVADPDDGYNRFERLARRIHERYTGMPFPYVAVPHDGARGPYDYMEVFHPDFEPRCRSTLERYFE